MSYIVLFDNDEQAEVLLDKTNPTIQDVVDKVFESGIVADFNIDTDEVDYHCIEAVGGRDVDDNWLDLILKSEAEEGAEGAIQLSVDKITTIAEEADRADEQEAQGPAAGAPGKVVVWSNGGVVSTEIDIINGRTTIEQVLDNESIQLKSGMTAAQVSACAVEYNGTTVAPNQKSIITVKDGDEIVINMMDLKHTKANR